MNTKIQSLYPNKKAMIEPDLTYQQFMQILIDNGIDVDPNELLNKYRSQGICVEVCDEWLIYKFIRSTDKRKLFKTFFQSVDKAVFNTFVDIFV